MSLRWLLLASALLAVGSLQVALPTRQGARAAAPVASAADFSKLTKKQLATKLKSAGLSTKGKKSELLFRLEEFTANPPDVSEAASDLLAALAETQAEAEPVVAEPVVAEGTSWPAVGGSAGVHRMAGRVQVGKRPRLHAPPVVGPLFEGARWGCSLLPDGASPWSDAALVVEPEETAAFTYAKADSPWADPALAVDVVEAVSADASPEAEEDNVAVVAAAAVAVAAVALYYGFAV